MVCTIANPSKLVLIMPWALHGPDHCAAIFVSYKDLIRLLQ